MPAAIRVVELGLAATVLISRLGSAAAEAVALKS
jgi:hypothetical protein